MNMNFNLNAISPIDGRYYDKVNSIRNYFNEYNLIHTRVCIEIQWLFALTNLPDFPNITEHIEAITNINNNFSFEDAIAIKEIEKTTNHDVKAVEYFIKQKLSHILGDNHPIIEFVHFCCTSTDIDNLAYALMLKRSISFAMLPLLQELLALIRSYAYDYKCIPLLSYTHGQPASPTTLGKEFANVFVRLKKQLTSLQSFEYVGKFNGAVGNFNAHHIAFPEVDWINFSKKFINSFGLVPNMLTTQIEPHDNIAELCHILNRINTILIDFCRNIWSYNSLHYFKQKLNPLEIGSSTMPHKINPIDFENAEGNLGIASALLTHFSNKLPISRFQRDLTDSTVLRNIGVSLAHCNISYSSIIKGLNKLEVNIPAIQTDLDNHPEILTEAIQTVMRRYSIPNSYEQLKTLSRGKSIDLNILHNFIQQSSLPDDAKIHLMSLTPSGYIGLAINLTDTIFI